MHTAMFKRTCLWEHNAGGEYSFPLHTRLINLLLTLS